MREFRTSIYSRPVARQRPTYHTFSWLDIVRGEKRLAQKQAALEARIAELEAALRTTARDAEVAKRMLIVSPAPRSSCA